MIGITLLTPVDQLYRQGRPFAGDHKGLDGIGALFQMIGETIDISMCNIQPIATEGDLVVAHGEPSYTVKKTGRTVAGPLIHLFTFNADGKVMRFKE